MDFEKIHYLISVLSEHIDEDIMQVLQDSEEAPDWSAVAMTNVIKCYIYTMETVFHEKLPYSNVKDYFMFNGYTEEEYRCFESKRLKESAYYRGIQY